MAKEGFVTLVYMRNDKKDLLVLKEESDQSTSPDEGRLRNQSPPLFYGNFDLPYTNFFPSTPFQPDITDSFSPQNSSSLIFTFVLVHFLSISSTHPD